MYHKASDQFGRTVFFQEKLERQESDTFIAFNVLGEACFYRTRHRCDGPAMIDSRKRRRWFFSGEEKTKEIEKAICSSDVECFENSEDFRLNQAGKHILVMVLML